MTLLIFLIILSILVLIHEFGHFVVAKKAGVRVEEFALGFPPRLWSKKIGETRYSINALPIGGYVHLFGEDTPTETESHRSFFAQSLPVKLAVALAGALMNLLLGIFAFTVLYMNVGIPVSTQNYPIVVGVAPGSPAETADIKPFDRITKIGEIDVKNDGDVRAATKAYAGQGAKIEIDRTPLTLLATMAVVQASKEHVATIAYPRVNPAAGEGALGIAIDNLSVTTTAYYPWYQMIPKAVVQGTRDSIGFAKQIVTTLGLAIKNLAVHKVVPQDISGPVGIFQVVDLAARTGGILPLLSLMGAISINLAVVNALPFPGLDGARALFVVVHGVTRRKIAPAIEKNIHLVGIVILLLLVLLISIRDVRRLFG